LHYNANNRYICFAMVTRIIQNKIIQHCFIGKAIVLLGARQVGKTTMLKQIQQQLQVPSIWLNADEADIRKELTEAETSTRLLQLIGKNNKLAIIDEAQQIPNIGKKIKLLFDTNPEIQIIATGSSAFELQNEMNEPLTGRKKEFYLYPISMQEMVNHHGHLTEKRLLENRLIYGSYPEVINNNGNEKEVLIELANSYLYKDMLQLDGVRKASVLEKLLQALAMQVGSEVRYHELAKTVGNIAPATVEKYLDMLEKIGIIFKLNSFSRSNANELTKSKKYYFHDNGIRNVLISNFNQIDLRTDKGALWENYTIAERKKRNHYTAHYSNNYFWRTTDQAEIDYLEETNGVLHAYEMKWTEQKVKFAKSFTTAYPNHELHIVNKENYSDFLLD
jgi:uncharacterized protein